MRARALIRGEYVYTVVFDGRKARVGRSLWITRPEETTGKRLERRGVGCRNEEET